VYELTPVPLVKVFYPSNGLGEGTAAVGTLLRHHPQERDRWLGSDEPVRARKRNQSSGAGVPSAGRAGFRSAARRRRADPALAFDDRAAEATESGTTSQ
jgi:hypothetical protein